MKDVPSTSRCLRRAEVGVTLRRFAPLLRGFRVCIFLVRRVSVVICGGFWRGRFCRQGGVLTRLHIREEVAPVNEG